MSDSIRGQYEAHGARGYYERFGAEYANPHEATIAEIVPEAVAARLGQPPFAQAAPRVLDLACGSGEVTGALVDRLGWPPEAIVACDPYTGAAFAARHDRAAQPWSFEDVAAGVLDAQPRFGAVVCSFALHLADPSRLPGICWALARAADWLIILTPHKRPDVRPAWGWRLDEERVHERVRLRAYASTLSPGATTTP